MCIMYKLRRVSLESRSLPEALETRLRSGNMNILNTRQCLLSRCRELIYVLRLDRVLTAGLTLATARRRVCHDGLNERVTNSGRGGKVLINWRPVQTRSVE